MQLVLPHEATGRRMDLLQFAHPRTNLPAKFLVDSGVAAPHILYELTQVGSDMRSALIGNTMNSDGSVVVATPLHPLFMVIGALYRHRNKPFPLEILLELATTDDCQELPIETVEQYIAVICDEDSGKYVLNMEKLKHFLDTRTARVQAGLPYVVREEVVRAIQPIDPTASPSPEMMHAAEQYGAVSMLTTSWLAPEVAEWYMQTYDFSLLKAEVDRLQSQQAALQYVQFASSGDTNDRGTKRPAETPAVKSKQPKIIKARNNASILDMFKKK